MPSARPNYFIRCKHIASIHVASTSGYDNAKVQTKKLKFALRQAMRPEGGGAV